jgi:hypothetical protein
MMEINPKELQKFHDLWAPMIAALPAVINAAERANELVNHTAILEARLQDVVSETVKAATEKDAHIQEAHLRVALVDAERVAKRNEADDQLKEINKEVKAAKAAADAKIKEHMERADVAALAADAVAEDLRKRLEAADRDFLAQKNEHDTILAALMAKEEAVRASIESLRAQLA